MRLFLNPSVPELVRVNSENLDEAVAQLVGSLTPSSGGFNYLEATKCAKAAYKGLHQLRLLTAARRLNDGSVGAKSNLEVAKLVCPISFSRKTQIFDLSPRSFHYGSGRSASYRVPFIFVEAGVVKFYFLQPRKSTVYTTKQFSLLASIVKKHLLDSEFYGEQTDIEIVDVAEPSKGEGRRVKVLSLNEVEIIEDWKIEKHLSVVLEALRFIEANGLVTKARRPLKDSELPLFS